MKTIIHVALSSLVGLAACNSPEQASKPVADKDTNSTKPNIIIILADDLGYSDLGCYGSEIKTPNLDRMARDGLMMTQFYNCARSCPSRASLLTGLYPAQAGIGHMSFGLKLQPGNRHYEPYQGYFPDNLPTIADVLKANGYTTIHVGKWHVGDKEAHRPWKHGFEKIYGKNAGGHYFNYDDYKVKLWYNDTATVSLPNDKYITDAFTEQAIHFIEDNPKNKPFFLYLAYTAPHFPVQALPEDIQRYMPVYSVGWDSIRQQRYQRMRQSDIISEDWALSPKYEEPDYTPDWHTLNNKHKNQWTRRMATHAAMTEHMDKGIGQLLTYLEKSQQDSNTVVMFLSDNGADSWDVYNRYENRRNPEAQIGLPGSFDGIGPAWANMCNTPFWLFKSWTAEGGIATPFIAYAPGRITPGQRNTQTPAIIMDLLPTCLELAGADFPKTHNNKATTPLAGQSLVPLFNGKTIDSERVFCWEHQGHKAIRQGDWKLIFIREHKHDLQNRWYLFNLKNDRTETTNLIDQYPDKAEELKKHWKQWAERTGVVPWDSVNIW